MEMKKIKLHSSLTHKIFNLFGIIFIAIIILLILMSRLVRTSNIDVTSVCGFLLIVPLTGVVGAVNEKNKIHISFVALNMTFWIMVALGLSFLNFEFSKRWALGLGFFAAASSILITVSDTVFQGETDKLAAQEKINSRDHLKKHE